MKKTGLILMVLVVSISYAQQRLVMMDARSEPEKFSSGDETIVSVRVIDTQGVVAEVTATVREERSIILDLNDSDGVWSLAFEVPGEASAGEYNWDFEAFDANGDPVKVTTEEGSEEPLTAEASVEVVSRTQRPADPTQSDNLSSTSGIAGIKISELICPVIEVPLKSKDGIDLSFAYRTPPGKGPYPAILFFHGGGGQSNLQRLKYDLLTGAVQTRFLQAGFIIVAATRRPYWKSKDANQPTGFYDAVE
ncbi:MAG: alpha/beta hydrolase family protein, partial [Planctomycetota bacterium]